MEAGEVELQLRAGETWIRVVSLEEQESGALIPLALPAALEVRIAPHRGDDLIMRVDSTDGGIQEDGDGGLLITINKGDTDGLAQGARFYDLWAVIPDESDDMSPILFGSFTVFDRVTETLA